MNFPLDTAASEPVAPAPPDRDMALVTEGLTKQFSRRIAVDGLTMRVPRGTITGFVGPNGAGKTTTIRLLLGLMRPSAGSGAVLGSSISHPSAYLRRVGALVDMPAFYSGLSARKNLEVLARLGGIWARRTDEVLGEVGLADRADDPVRNYSLGMKQRLGIAMALLPDPELLILDEPANGLDPMGIIEIRDLLRHLQSQGKTIFLSSHLLGELERVADWLVILDKGRAVYTGPARDFFAGAGELIVAAATAEQLDIVIRIAEEAGHHSYIENGAAHITCPPDFARELSRRATEAGATLVEIQRSQASLEDQFLALLKGERP